MKALITEGKEILLEMNEKEEEHDKYIFRTGNALRSDLIELTVGLRNEPTKRVMIMANPKDNVAFMCQAIGEAFENFREYQGLASLRAVKVVVQKTKKPILMQGRIEDYVRDGDELICEIEASEMWINVRYEMSCGQDNRHASVELKVERNCIVKYLRLVIEKLALNLWSYIHSDKSIYYYVLRHLDIKATEMVIVDSSISEHFENWKNLDASQDKKTICEVISASSILNVDVTISTVEEMISMESDNEIEHKPRHKNSLEYKKSLNLQPPLYFSTVERKIASPSKLSSYQQFEQLLDSEKIIMKKELFGLFVVGSTEVGPEIEAGEEINEMLLSTVLEEDPKSTKSMKTIKSRLESKLINLSILRPRRKSAELRLRAVTEVAPDRGGDTAPREIPYIQAIEMVKIDPQFLSIEELKRVKIFPLRGWRVNKKAKMVSVDHPAPPTENPLKLIVIVLIVFGAIIVIVSIVLINIS